MVYVFWRIAGLEEPALGGRAQEGSRTWAVGPGAGGDPVRPVYAASSDVPAGFAPPIARSQGLPGVAGSSIIVNMARTLLADDGEQV